MPKIEMGPPHFSAFQHWKGIISNIEQNFNIHEGLISPGDRWTSDVARFKNSTVIHLYSQLEFHFHSVQRVQIMLPVPFDQESLKKLLVKGRQICEAKNYLFNIRQRCEEFEILFNYSLSPAAK